MIDQFLELLGHAWVYIAGFVVIVIVPSLVYYYLKRRIGWVWAFLVVTFPILFGALYMVFNRGKFG